jgi:hypothetical protein
MANIFKTLDLYTWIMIFCLACIFSLTILNKIGLLTNWILYALLGFFLLIMIICLVLSIKKEKQIGKQVNKKEKTNKKKK